MNQLEADFLEKPQSSPMPLILTASLVGLFLIVALLGMFLFSIWPWGQA